MEICNSISQSGVLAEVTAGEHADFLVALTATVLGPVTFTRSTLPPGSDGRTTHSSFCIGSSFEVTHE